MGVENNEVIIATTYSNDAVEQVKQWIDSLEVDDPFHSYKQLFVFIPAIVNQKTTVVYAPDGSKKGWGVANQSEQIRQQFKQFLDSFDYDDGSNPFDWVEIGYGEYGQAILDGNCFNMYNNNPYALDTINEKSLANYLLNNQEINDNN